MFLRKIIAECTFPEREEAVKACMELSKTHSVVVNLIVYRNSYKEKTEVTINKRSKENNILRYIEKQLSNFSCLRK